MSTPQEVLPWFRAIMNQVDILPDKVPADPLQAAAYRLAEAECAIQKVRQEEETHWRREGSLEKSPPVHYLIRKIRMEFASYDERLLKRYRGEAESRRLKAFADWLAEHQTSPGSERS